MRGRGREKNYPEENQLKRLRRWSWAEKGGVSFAKGVYERSKLRSFLCRLSWRSGDQKRFVCRIRDAKGLTVEKENFLMATCFDVFLSFPALLMCRLPSFNSIQDPIMIRTKSKCNANAAAAPFRFGRLAIAGVASVGVLLASAAHAQMEIYVLRVGDGGTINANYAPFSVMQYSGGGSSATLANSWDAPSTDAADRITVGASFTTFAHLTRSVDGKSLSFVGRDVVVGGVKNDAENVVIASFALQTQMFDTSTRLPKVGGNGYRAAVTTDGSEFWFSGQGGGLHYATRGQITESGSILTTGAGNASAAQTGSVQIVNNRIIFSRRAGSDRGIQYMDPVGLHTTHGNDRILIEGAGWKRTSGDPPSSYNGFEFLDGNTLFVANYHEIQVYSRSNQTGGEFENFDLLTGPNQGLPGLTGESHLSLLEQNGEVYLYYTSGMGTNDNGLWSVLWDPDAQEFGTPDLLASAGDGYTFGGLVAIPEPSTYALLFGVVCLTVVVGIRRRRR